MSGEAKRSIFRGDAVRRYAQSREQAVLPRFVSPPTFLCLWILLGLLAASGFVAGITPVPVYASGPAIMIHRQDRTLPPSHDMVVVAFLPPESLSHLRVGQRMFLTWSGTGERFSRPVFTIEPKILSPGAARKRFALDAATARAITGPAAVAMARWESIPASPAAPAYAGSICRVDIEVGSCRVVSLLPRPGR
jgi:hypothetical protein